MNILGTQKERTGYKLIGMSVKLDIHHYLTIYSLAKGIKKAVLLKTMLDDWIKDQKSKNEDTTLLKGIARRGTNEWKAAKIRGVSLLEFKGDLEKELLKKGLYEVEVKRVLNEIE